MNTHDESKRPSGREAFRCTGQQLDAILQFAEKRCYEDRPLRWVVEQYLRLPARRLTVCGGA